MRRYLVPLAGLVLPLLLSAPALAQDPAPGEPRRELRLQPPAAGALAC
jgi:hypothetical protein